VLEVECGDGRGAQALCDGDHDGVYQTEAQHLVAPADPLGRRQIVRPAPLDAEGARREIGQLGRGAPVAYPYRPSM
jgi:hypothetical protein